ncbi:glycosyltransferase family 2 protein [Candidatus Pacearchaeota archaeon]|nr:glycosyltransferase family 2 protein [Candidatus Pacearchaeota archaeon]
MKKLSIIIPVYNEEKTIIQILDKVWDVDLSTGKEIIIVNDGSKDNSEGIIKKYLAKKKETKKITFKFISKENGGKGSAIKAGIDRARGDFLIMQDADSEYNPQEIKNLIEEIRKGKNKVIYGSRILGDNPYQYFTYYLGNRFLSFLTSVLYGQKITDMETCYKLIPTNIAKSLYLRAKGFDMEPEITAKILKKGYKIKEIPISYNPRSKEEGKKINWKDGLKAVYVLLYWRFKGI